MWFSMEGNFQHYTKMAMLTLICIHMVLHPELLRKLRTSSRHCCRKQQTARDSFRHIWWHSRNFVNIVSKRIQMNLQVASRVGHIDCNNPQKSCNIRKLPLHHRATRHIQGWCNQIRPRICNEGTLHQFLWLKLQKEIEK